MREFGAPRWRGYDHRARKHLANVSIGDQVSDAIERVGPASLQSRHAVAPFKDGQIRHPLSLLSGGSKRRFAIEMLAGVQSGHPQLMVKRHSHADRDEVHVGMLNHFARAGNGMGSPEMLDRFVSVSWRLAQTAVISNSGGALKAGIWVSRPSRSAHLLQ